MNGDTVLFQQGDVFNQQCHHAFAFDRCGALVGPHAREIFCQTQYAFLYVLRQQSFVSIAFQILFLLQVIQSPQLLIPFRLKCLCDQAVVRVHIDESAT